MNYKGICIEEWICLSMHDHSLTHSFPDLFVDLVELFVFVVAVEAVLVNQVGNGGLVLLGFDAHLFEEELFVFLDCAEQDLARDVAVLVLLDYLFDGCGVQLPDLLRDEGRVCQHEVEGVVELLRDQLRMVEVILEEVGVLHSEFGIILGEEGGTSKQKMGFSWLAFSME